MNIGLQQVLEEKRKQLEALKTAPDARVAHNYQHYGLEICEKLKFEPKLRGRLMRFLMKADGFRISKLCDQLLTKEKFINMNQESQFRYIVGAWKNMA